MNIYALKGHRITVTEETILNGSTGDKVLAKISLKVGEEYTVKRTDVEHWKTKVVLQELPNQIFNTVHFVDLDEQDPIKNKKHKDYSKYHK